MILYPLIGLGGSDNFSDIVKKSVDHTILTFKVLLLLLISFAVYLTSYLGFNQNRSLLDIAMIVRYSLLIISLLHV